jgi:hypothetical protein
MPCRHHPGQLFVTILCAGFEPAATRTLPESELAWIVNPRSLVGPHRHLAPVSLLFSQLSPRPLPSGARASSISLHANLLPNEIVPSLLARR